VPVPDLIRSLQERIRHPPSMDMDQLPPIRPGPRVPEKVVVQAERELGFSLHPLLRALYTEVGDGGFGPGCGFLPFAGNEWSLVELAKWKCVDVPDLEPTFPPRVVEVLSWGCHYMSCVDCSRELGPVWFYDHDCNIEGATNADYLYPEADSLENWLWAWLRGVDLWTTGPKMKKMAEQSKLPGGTP